MRTVERGVLVGIVVAIAAAARCGYVLAAQVVSPLRADAGQYAQCAKNLVEHGIYSLATTVPPPPDSFRSPGYPWLLALCRCLGGEAGWMALTIGVQTVLGVLTVLVCYRLARGLLPFAASLAAALLCALSPHLVVSSGYVLTECVTTFCVVTGVWLAADLRGNWRLAASALVLGYATLCNETLVWLPFLMACSMRRVGRMRALLFVLLSCAPLLAWTLRNQFQTLARTGSERAMASISHGSYPGMVFRDPRLFGYPYREDPEQPAFGSSWANLRAVLGQRIAVDPLRHIVWYAVEKPVWLWGWNLVQGRDVQVYDVANSPYERQPVMAATHWLMRWLHVPVMLLAACGAVWTAWNRRGRHAGLAQALGLLAIVGTLSYIPVIPDPRYLTPFRPALFVLGAAAGAAGLAWLWQHAPLRRATPLGATHRALPPPRR